MRRNLWYCLLLLLLFLFATSCQPSSDDGLIDDTPTEDGDGEGDEDGDEDGDDQEDGDLDGDEEQDEEQSDPLVDRCTGITDKNMNGVTITADAGGLVSICEKGNELDGSTIRIARRGLNEDATITISKVDDIVPAGWVAVGPAVQFKAVAMESGVTLELEEDAQISIPFSPLRTQGAKNYYVNIVCRLDEELGVSNGEDNAPFFLPKSPSSMDISSDYQHLFFENMYFGTYQVVVREQIGEPTTRHFTYRALGGFSMGGGASALTGIRYADKFDVIGPMGGLADLSYLLLTMHDRYLGGFCPYEEITAEGFDVTSTETECGEQVYQTNPDEEWWNPNLKWYCVAPNPDFLNEGCYDYCVNEKGLDAERCSFICNDEHAQGYNHWYYDGNGGKFDRKEYTKLFRDLSYAYGNVADYNEESPFFPRVLKGDVLEDYIANVYGDGEYNNGCPDTLAAWSLAHRFHGVYDDEFNPEGKYDVILFCDGSVENIGTYDPENTPQRADISLAVDINGNGKRDFGEPVIKNMWEPFEDCGADGLCDAQEAGYNAQTNPDPAGDNYHFRTNPMGTEGNGFWDDGESFQDTGLDGVAAIAADADGSEKDSTRQDEEPYEDIGVEGQEGTAGNEQYDVGEPFLDFGRDGHWALAADYGEGNSTYDRNPHVDTYLESDPRMNILRAGEEGRPTLEALKTTNVWLDGGIRDIFSFGLMADHMASFLDYRLREEGLTTTIVDDFPALMIPPPKSYGKYNYSRVNYAGLGHNVHVRYGNYEADNDLVFGGDGRHVGITQQIIFRMQSFLAFANYHFPNGDYEPVESYNINSLMQRHYFPSEVLGRHQKFSVTFPPGYFDGNQDSGTTDMTESNPFPEPKAHVCQNRYPVVYMLHGYGMDPEDLAPSLALFFSSMAEGKFQKFITIFPDGKCNEDGGCRSDCRMDCEALDLDDTEEAACISTCETRRDCGNVIEECVRGSFYANHKSTRSDPRGRTINVNGTEIQPAQLEDSMLELMDYVDTVFCTRAPEDVSVDPASLDGLY